MHELVKPVSDTSRLLTGLHYPPLDRSAVPRCAWGTLNARLEAMSAHVLAQQAVANAGGVVNVPMIFRYQ